MQVLGLLDEGDLCADVALERDELLGLEPADRLTHGHDAHVELAGDRAQHESVARHVAAVVDALADEAVRLLRLALGAHHDSSPFDVLGWRR